MCGGEGGVGREGVRCVCVGGGRGWREGGCDVCLCEYECLRDIVYVCVCVCVIECVMR